MSSRARARCCASYRRFLSRVAGLPCVSQRSCAVSKGAGRRIAVLAALYRHLDSPPSATIQNFVLRPSASQVARCIATQKATPNHDTNLNRDSPWPGHARAPRAQASSIVALPRRVVGVAWPYRGHALAAPRPVSLALCHDTLHCIVTQMGSSPSRCLLSIFFSFSHHFFFICSTYWNTLFFFSFSSRTK